MTTRKTTTKAAAPIEVTSEQWQGIATLGEAVAQSGYDAGQLVEAMKMEMEAVRKLSAMMAFLSGPAASGLTKGIVETTAFGVEHDLSATIGEMAMTVSALHHNGTLEKIRTWSQELGSTGGVVDWDALASEGLPDLNHLNAPSVSGVVGAVRAANKDADDDRENLGGLLGLIHMLRDPKVQHGMRILMTLPGYLRKAGAPAPGPAR